MPIIVRRNGILNCETLEEQLRLARSRSSLSQLPEPPPPEPPPDPPLLPPELPELPPLVPELPPEAPLFEPLVPDPVPFVVPLAPLPLVLLPLPSVLVLLPVGCWSFAQFVPLAPALLEQLVFGVLLVWAEAIPAAASTASEVTLATARRLKCFVIFGSFLCENRRAPRHSCAVGGISGQGATAGDRSPAVARTKRCQSRPPPGVLDWPPLDLPLPDLP